MKPSAELILTCFGLVALMLLSACAESKPSKPKPTVRRLVSITDFAVIAGKWEGALAPDPQPANAAQDVLRVVIATDGTYELSSFPDANLFTGRGKLMLLYGQAADRRGTVTFNLYEQPGGRTMAAGGLSRDGKPYTAWLGRPAELARTTGPAR